MSPAVAPAAFAVPPAAAVPRAAVLGLGQPTGAAVGVVARAPAACARRSCGASLGFHGVGRAYRPFCRGAIELTVCALVGCMSARPSSRCGAVRGNSAALRGSSAPCSRVRRMPSDASSHALACRQRTSSSQGSPTKNSTIIASGVPMRPSTCSKPPASAWPNAFVVASPGSAAASVQLAASTHRKPSHSRIEPGPARPLPPGSIALTSRQKRGMNQTAEKPNQPRTTVCMLRDSSETEEGWARDARSR